MTKPTTPQPDLFSQRADDLPLFSGTPMRAELPQPPTFTRRAPSLFGDQCPICYGTGEVVTKKNAAPSRCTCAAGARQSQDQEPAHRGFRQIIDDLDALRQSLDLNDPARRVCEALHYGYSSARTPHVLELHLIYSPDLRPVVNSIAAAWDGQDHLSGALHAAKTWAIANPCPHSPYQEPTP